MEVVEGRATVGDLEAFLDDLRAVGEEYGCVVQAFDARYVVDREHLERAVELADRARERGEAIADDHAVEILLYAAGRRQINRALGMGVSEGECPVVVVVHGGTPATDDGGESDEGKAAAAVADLLAPAETLGSFEEDRVVEFFDVSPAERGATDAGLAALVRERVALLPVER